MGKIIESVQVIDQSEHLCVKPKEVGKIFNKYFSTLTWESYWRCLRDSQDYDRGDDGCLKMYEDRSISKA